MKALLLPAAVGIMLLAGFVLGRTWATGAVEAGPQGDTPPAPSSLADEAALEDGVVSREEYEAAFHRFASCLESAGFRFAEGPVLTRFETYYYVLARDGTDAAAAQADRERCQRTFDAVQFRWATDHRPTDQDHAEAARLTASCLRAGGVSVSAEPGHDELRAALGMPGRLSPMAVACLKETGAALDWPGYGP